MNPIDHPHGGGGGHQLVEKNLQSHEVILHLEEVEKRINTVII